MNIDRQPNMHDLSWFVDMDSQKRLDLNPPYQRKSVWTAPDRYYFLDTIFNNYPCPAVYVQKEIGNNGPTYNVVDGKQRISTILNFYQNKIKLPKNFSISRLSGKRFRDLEKSDVIAFYNYVFLVETLKASGDTEWNEVFFRVNKNQKRLTDQELRHARFDGWFITRAEKECENPKEDSGLFWSTMKISTTTKSRRMKDIEFISILMLIILEHNFVGFPQSNIDELYAKYNFELSELPTEDTEVSDTSEEIQDQEIEIFEPGEPKLLREDIDTFEQKFTDIKAFISRMEEHNSAITKHTRRLTTDFYSLWSLLTLSSDIMTRFSSETIAIYYDQFISGVDEIYDQMRDNKTSEPPSTSSGQNILKYYNHSIGASTTAEYRKIRYETLKAYIEANAS